MALNKPFTASLSSGTKQPCWRGRDALEWDKQSKLPFHMGHFPYSPKTFENLENGAEISRKRFQKFWKVLNFRNENHSTENSGNSGSKVEWKENFRGNIFENLGIPREVFLFFGNFGKCCSFRYWKLLRIQTKRFGWMESTPRCTCTHGCFVPWLTAKGLLTRTNAI